MGYISVCSDEVIYNNICIENKTWCSSEDAPCFQYFNNEITREELDSYCEDDGFVCYESQMLREWKAYAGVVQTGNRKGEPMKLQKVQHNSLCVLTTRNPQMIEDDRYCGDVLIQMSAINKALEDVENKDTGEIPMNIRNAPVKQMESLGYHQGYLYPHDFPGHYVEQQYLPDKMLGTKYYIKDENIE